MVVLCRHPRIVVRNDVDLPHGCCRSSLRADADSVQADTDFLGRWAWIFSADSG